MSKTNAQRARKEPEQRRLAVVSSPDQEAQEKNRKMSQHPSIWNKSNTQIQPATGSLPENYTGYFTTQTVTENKEDSSSNSGTGRESPSQRRERIHREVEEMATLYPPGTGNDRQGEQAITLNITINTFGNPEVAMQSVLLNMGRALHHAFGDSFEMRKMDGVRVIYDSFAHDGEHLGHNEALKLVKDDPPCGS